LPNVIAKLLIVY